MAAETKTVTPTSNVLTGQNSGTSKGFDDLLKLMDEIPEIQAPVHPLKWDEHGLPE
jgi:hypothetical protein